MKPLDHRFLTADDYPRLYRAFREAFADYGLDMSYLNERNLGHRWTKNGVSYGSSVGAFDGDRSDPATRALLEKFGFVIYTRQYEMEMTL